MWSRALSLDELAQLFEKIRETPRFGPENALALKLLLALCVRKGELLGARWEEFEERCLGHAIRGIEGTYDRHDYFKSAGRARAVDRSAD